MAWSDRWNSNSNIAEFRTSAFAQACVSSTAQALTPDHFPIVLPTSDVEVDYAVRHATDGHIEQKLFYSAATGTGRLELDSDTVVLENINLGTVAFLNLPHSVAVQMPPDMAINFIHTEAPPRDAQIEALNDLNVANHQCKEFHFILKFNNQILCITKDGVTLATENENPGSIGMGLIAMAIRFGNLPSGLFQIPTGFTIVRAKDPS